HVSRHIRQAHSPPWLDSQSKQGRRAARPRAPRPLPCRAIRTPSDQDGCHQGRRRHTSGQHDVRHGLRSRQWLSPHLLRPAHGDRRKRWRTLPDQSPRQAPKGHSRRQPVALHGQGDGCRGRPNRRQHRHPQGLDGV
ncbi:uncharacterized protein METZ01_LOCUS162619, partial [marine metagenome]